MITGVVSQFTWSPMTDAESLHDHRSPIHSTGADSAADGFLSIRTLTAPFSALAFWAAIALPALYLPMFLTGLDSGNELLVFLGLFALHLVALFAGRTHRRT